MVEHADGEGDRDLLRRQALDEPEEVLAGHEHLGLVVEVDDAVVNALRL